MATAPQNPNQAIDAMVPITATHIVLMALLALAAIATIWWGTVLYLRRKRAAAQVRDNYETAEAHGATTEPIATTPGEETATLSADVPEPAATGPDSLPVAPSAPAGGTPIAADLTQIKGLGPKLAATLADLGITRVGQIAALTPAAAAALDMKLGSFQGRMARDRWIEQARLLTAGDRAGYEAAFGKLGG